MYRAHGGIKGRCLKNEASSGKKAENKQETVVMYRLLGVGVPIAQNSAFLLVTPYIQGRFRRGAAAFLSTPYSSRQSTRVSESQTKQPLLRRSWVIAS